MSELPIANTDREIWRETPGDYYSPSIHVTQHGGIGLSVAGSVSVRSIREWAASAPKSFVDDQAAKIERLREEVDDLKHELDLVRSVARADNLKGELADSYELWLLEIGKLFGCGHLDERLPRCAEESFTALRTRVAELEASERKLREACEEGDAALAALLDDTQHCEHSCDDANCPVAKAIDARVTIGIALLKTGNTDAIGRD